MRWCFFSPTVKSRDVLRGDTRNSGGAEAQVAYLARALAQEGHEVALIYGEGDANLATEVISGVTCIDAVPEWRPGAAVAFWRTLRQLDPDVIYARLPSDFLLIIRLYAKWSRAKFVYAIASSLHCNPWTAYDYNRWFHGSMFSAGLHGADIVAVQHEQQASLLHFSLQQRTAHVPNLVCFFSDQPRSFDNARYDAIWLGVIRPEKRILHFLELASALPNLQFAIVGGFDLHHDAVSRAVLEKHMRALPNLSIIGRQRSKEVQLYLTQSKVLVSTSVVEGFPNAMLEAWSVGVPVVSLSVDPGGVIEREGLGRLSGAMIGLINDVVELTRNRKLNMQIGSRGLDYVRRTHSWENVHSSLTEALSRAYAAEPVIQSS